MSFGSLAFDLAAEFVPLAAGGFQVEHQVFHVEPQLAEGVLDEIQDAAAAERAFLDAIEDRQDRPAVFGGEIGQEGFEFDHIGGELFDSGGDVRRGFGHGELFAPGEGDMRAIRSRRAKDLERLGLVS
jgi:hypothetical protein